MGSGESVHSILEVGGRAPGGYNQIEETAYSMLRTLSNKFKADFQGN